MGSAEAEPAAAAAATDASEHAKPG
eukprot:COSAG03_NODE_26712_length_257_cov_0.981013_1_plen_24_part_10